MHTPNIYTFNIIKTKKIKHTLVYLQIVLDVENFQITLKQRTNICILKGIFTMKVFWSQKYRKNNQYTYFEAYFDNESISKLKVHKKNYIYRQNILELMKSHAK